MSVAGGNTYGRPLVPVINASVDVPVATVVGRADRRTVTVMFCDIVDSTSLVVAQDPEDAYDQLSGLIGIMISHVRRYGGTLCQTLGDGIYAIFGAPSAQEDHAVRACFAADAILREVGRSKNAVRIGLNSGEVLWTRDASDRQGGVPATGGTVHIAAKLQQAAAANQTLMTEATALLASSWIDTRLASNIVVAKKELVTAHMLLATRRRRMAADENLPMVGRATIREVLSASWHGVLGGGTGDNGCSRLHLLAGEPGMGKTRLVSEVAQEARQAGLRVIEWQLPALTAVGVPAPLSELATEFLDSPLPATVDGTIALIRATGASALHAEALARLLHPLQGQVRPREGEGEASSLSMAVEALTMLARIAVERRPTLLIVEDLHWAGSAEAMALSGLAGIVDGVSMVIIVTSRHVSLPAEIETAEKFTVHPLLPLGRDDVLEMLDQWLGLAPSVDPIKSDLVRRVAGNPFFLVECVRTLMERDALTGLFGDMRPGSQPLLALPETIQTLLSARVDRLDEDGRSLLRTAAVVGPTFDAVVLRALMPGLDVEKILRLLVDAGLIDQTRLLPRLEYSFHHALLHEAVYEGLTRRDRRDLHGKIARLLDDAEFASLPGRVAAQARHASSGQCWSLAVQAGRKAGDEALRRSLASEAFQLLVIAVDANEHLPDEANKDRDRMDLRVKLARAAMPAGHHGRAMEELRTVMTLAEAQGDYERLQTSMAQMISFEWIYGSLIRATDLANSLIARSGGIDKSHPELLSVAGGCWLERGNVYEALRHVDVALGSSAWDGHRPGQFYIVDTATLSLIKRARCLEILGARDEADACVARAILRTDAAGVPFARIYIRTDAADVRLRQRRYSDVIALCTEALAIARSVRATLFDPIIMARMGLAMLYLGNTVEGHRNIDQAARLTERRGRSNHWAWVNYYRMLAQMHAGDLDQATASRDLVQALSIENGYGLILDDMQTEFSTRAGSRLEYS